MNYEFDLDKTFDGDFIKLDGTTEKAHFMTAKRNMKMGSSSTLGDAQVLVLDYGKSVRAESDPEFSAVFILPREKVPNQWSR